MINYVNFITSCIQIVLYLVSLFLISEIRKRTKEGLNKGLTWIATAIVILTISKVLNILDDFYIVNSIYVDYSIYALMILFALTFTIGIYIMLSSIEKFSDRKRR